MGDLQLIHCSGGAPAEDKGSVGQASAGNQHPMSADGVLAALVPITWDSGGWFKRPYMHEWNSH